jgi:hypothetical protein
MIQLEVLDKIINNHNNTINIGVGYAPNKVSDAIENKIVNDKKEETIDIKSIIAMVAFHVKTPELNERG